MFAALKSFTPSFTLPKFDFSIFSTNDKEELPYIKDNLPEEQILELEKLLSLLSVEDFPKFLLNFTSLISFGKQTSNIHPFNTFEFFLSTEERIEKTKKIYHKTGVQLGFEHYKTESIKGFCRFLQERDKKGQLEPNLKNFCDKTKKDIILLKSLIIENKFEEFVEEILVKF